MSRAEPRRAAVFGPAENSVGSIPCVYYFHGNSGSINDSIKRRNFHELWPSAIIVYCEGTDINSHGIPDGNEQLAWQCRFPYKFSLGQTKDIEYVSGLHRKVERLYTVDREKVFATGHSSGGFFTLSLMEHMPGIFSAFAAVACYGRFAVQNADRITMEKNRVMPRDMSNSEVAAYPRPVLYVFGQYDTSIGNDWPSNMPWWQPDTTTNQKTLTTVKQLLVRNGCGAPSITSPKWVQNGMSNKIMPNSNNGASVQWYKHGGAHEWPSGMNMIVIDFFKNQ